VLAGGLKSKRLLDESMYMRSWHFGVFVMTILLAQADRGVGADRAEPTIDALLKKAGNAAGDGHRAKILQQVLKREGVSEELERDIKRVIRNYRPETVKKSSPVYPMACFNMGRNLLTKTIQYAQIWHYEDRRNRNFTRINAWFKLAADAYPDNPVLQTYLGNSPPWPSPSWSKSSGEPAPPARLSPTNS
jgi:hypothetical protein